MDKVRGVRKRQQQEDARDADGKLRPNRWVDAFTLALTKQRDDARGGWGEWLAGFRWQIYTILTLARRPSSAGAQRAVNEWLEELRRTYPRLAAYVSYDWGKGGGGRLNVHVFLSGLFLRKPPQSAQHRALTITRAIEVARRTWTSGLVKKIEPFDPRRGAPNYLAQYCNEQELGGEFFGRPIRKKKRRQRK